MVCRVYVMRLVEGKGVYPVLMESKKLHSRLIEHLNLLLLDQIEHLFLKEHFKQIVFCSFVYNELQCVYSYY